MEHGELDDRLEALTTGVMNEDPLIRDRPGYSSDSSFEA